ncbi:YceI family protein [Mesorhizobium sp. KR9-304]|uniref:YceI family protein n=1 Tax=Mesorhizobium sp. KR9-304 TaxID=3156614 RepID=UPI0032B46AA3
MRSSSLQTRVRAGLAAFLLAAPLAGFSATAQAAADALSDAAGSYRIDKSSSIRFAVDQVGGGGIKGSFPDYKGSFRIDGSNVGKSKVTITLYPESVHANEARVENFLRSDAVFDVAEYPEITFRSTAVTRTGSSTARIDGVLTARGKSRPATFQATVGKQKGGAISFHVTGSIYRSPYGMGVGTPIYSNLVQFDMTLHGTRN